MKTINRDEFTKALDVLFSETFEGSPRGQGSVYLDRGIGIFRTLENVSAKDASQPIHKNGATIAAHTEHARFYLDILNKYLHQKAVIVDWNNSWAIKKVDDESWKALQSDLRIAYQIIKETFEKQENWDLDTISVAIAIVSHSAYHLSAIRQICKTLNERPQEIDGKAFNLNWPDKIN
jgi:hypothetical protein